VACRVSVRWLVLVLWGGQRRVGSVGGGSSYDVCMWVCAVGGGGCQMHIFDTRSD
jgi:hypothetical protein